VAYILLMTLIHVLISAMSNCDASVVAYFHTLLALLAFTVQKAAVP